MNAKNAVLGAFVVALAASAFASVPQVTYVQMEQSTSSRLVTIRYKFSGDDAVITLDVQTNANTSASANDPGWTSIGGPAVCNAQGEVWKKVAKGSDDTVHTITWRPDKSWTGENGEGFVIAANGARAVVKAWALNNTPDYMVVDISNSSIPNTQDARCRYYPSVDFLPGSSPGQVGAVTNNANFKTSLLVMRKICAKDVTWIMGSTPLESDRSRYENGRGENTHPVTLTNDYYIGIFELTQGQWAEVVPSGRSYPSFFYNPTYRAGRPVERICYNDLRCGDCNTDQSSDFGGHYPDAPYADSFLGRLRSRTGVDFDLPSDAQWEFACRAGHGDTKYGDGSTVLNMYNGADANLARIARYSKNPDGNSVNPGADVDTSKGTSTVGTYAPNDWGLYDMLGNVQDLVLDKFAFNNTTLNGAVCTTTSDLFDGKEKIIGRGGHYVSAASWCRPAYREHYFPGDRSRAQLGFRVACRAGLD